MSDYYFLQPVYTKFRLIIPSILFAVLLRHYTAFPTLGPGLNLFLIRQHFGS